MGKGKLAPCCACGKIMEKVVEGDDVADPICICRKCHKIIADGWKWG